MDLGFKLEFAKRTRKCFNSKETIYPGEMCLTTFLDNGFGHKKVSFKKDTALAILDNKIEKYEALIAKAKKMKTELKNS